MRVGIITSSDKGFAGLREDVSGATLVNMCKDKGYEVCETVILPDDFESLKACMIDFCDNKKYDLILTTGGTGFSVRDITPEATKAVIERETQGLCEAMRYYSLKITKRAMLSRAVSGIRGMSLIVNLPGSPKAVVENLGFVIDEIEHGIDILKGSANECAR